MTTFTEKYLKPDIFTENITFDEYCGELSEIYFKPEVPEAVSQSYKVIESLRAFSYYNHHFIDTAVTQALHIFEMALKLKYKELYPDNGYKGLNGTIKHFIKIGLFEAPDKVLEEYNKWRNDLAHPEEFKVGGLFFTYAITQICHLINDLYEDVELRKERIAAFEEFKKLQLDNKLDKFLVYNSPKGMLKLFFIQVAFINNKLNPTEYTFTYVPLFTIGSPIQLNAVQIINPKIEDGVLILTDAISKKEYVFYPSTYSPEVHEKFEEWKTYLKEYDKRNLHHIEILKLHGSYFNPLMMQFYKM